MVNVYTSYFATWNKNIKIVQDIRQTSLTDQQIRFQLAMTEPEKQINTDWLPYPHDTPQAWLSTLKTAFPFIDEDDSNYPIVDLTYTKRMRRLLCSSLLLKDGTLVKRYCPMTETVALVKDRKKYGGAIFLNDGKVLKGKQLHQIVAILER